jgi:hypothetical protein
MGKCKVCGEEVFAGCPELADDTYYCSTACIKEFHNQELNCEEELLYNSDNDTTPDDKVRIKSHSSRRLSSSQFKLNQGAN